MAWRFPLSTSQANTIVGLGGTDGAIVGQSVTLATTAQQTIFGAGSDHDVRVYGTVLSSFSCVGLGDGGDSSDNSITVSKTGYVECVNEETLTAAVGFSSSNSTLTNAGTIKATGFGVLMEGNGGDGSVLVNSGLIDGSYGGVVRAGTQALTFTNTGTVTSTNVAYGGSLSGDEVAIDKIINSGRMTGAVFLAGGNDLYDGRKGHVTGRVDGDAGADTLYGGTEANVLAGGLGRDRLFGGKGNDTFVFDTALSKTTNVDRVLDFANASGNNDRFQLDDAVFKALKTGGLAEAAFKDLGVKDAKVDGSDRLVYNSKTGDLAYDADGSGKTAAILFAHLDNHAKLAAADFVVV